MSIPRDTAAVLMNNQALFAVTNDLSTSRVPFLLAPLKNADDTWEVRSLSRARTRGKDLAVDWQLANFFLPPRAIRIIDYEDRDCLEHAKVLVALTRY